MDFSFFEKRSGVTFKNKSLLQQAFTHQSFPGSNQHVPPGNNERLEFLGDAVLGLIVTNYLFRKYPDKAEGDLTEYRTALVNTHALIIAAEKLGINDFLLLSQSEARNTNDDTRKSILADTLEAVLEAIYLDRGLDTTERFVEKYFLYKTDERIREGLLQNPKGRLQQIAQSVLKVMPRYRVLKKTGTAHDKEFVVGVYFGSELIAQGRGKAKKLAEVQAAAAALAHMQQTPPRSDNFE